MDIASLSEIFDDPLLNEFTDDLLNDIDVSDLRFIHSNLENNGLVEDDTWRTSNHCTLEALLKSQKPLSCVPPAPELRSDLSVGNLKCAVPRVPPLHDSNSMYRRNSLPLLKQEGESFCVADKRTYQRSKSKLISDYLGKCDDNLNSNSPGFRWRDQNITSTERNFAKKELYVESFSGESATESPEQSIDTPDNFRRSEISPAFEPNTYSSQPSCDEKNVRRAPHNAIEKRYRASINGRIDELRNLLIPHPTSETKLNKSAVLRQAIERIKELEETTSRLQAELMTLRSLQTSDHMKPCHNSPDSGISSSSGSSYSGLDGAGLTPPSSGALNGTMYRAPMESPSVVYPSKDIVSSANEAVDVFNWAPEVPPAASFVDFPEPGLSYAHHVSYPYEMNTVELQHCYPTEPSTANLHVVHSEDGALWRSHSGNALTEQATPGGRFKRRAVSIHPGPTKLRRSTVVSPEFSTPPRSSVPTVIRSGSLLVKTCATSGPGIQSPAAPTFSAVQRWPQSTRPSMELPTNSTITSEVQPVQVAGSGLNGWAARTTLCMTALSLIALDPVVLSGTAANDPVHSSSSPDPSSRRLLSALNTTGQTSSPLIVWLVYAVQWIVALGLCLWACRLRSQRVAYAEAQPKHALVQDEWDDGRKALNQAAWSLAEQKLFNCLAKLDPEPRFAITPSTLAQKCINQLHGLFDWLVLGIQISLGILVRLPSLWLARFRQTSPTSQPKSLSHRSTDSESLRQLTLTNVRWSMIELHLLAPRGSLGNWLPFDRSFASLRFLWRCSKSFMDDCLVVFASGCTQSLSADQSHSVDLLLRRGITLILVLRRLGSMRWKKLLSGFQFLVQRFIRHLSSLSHQQTLWSRIACDPVLWKLIIGPARLVITTEGRTNDASEDPLAEAVQKALEQKLMDRCSRAMVAACRACDLAELDQSLNALLTLCSDADTHNEAVGSELLSSHVSKHDIQASWWAQVIRAMRITRQQSVSEVSVPESPLTTDSVVPILPVPPPVVLQCTQTGRLAESVWLVYCPSSALDTVEAAQRCGLGLSRYVKQISFHGSVENEGHGGPLFDGDAIPYWILVCAQTVADRALNILARTLLLSKTNSLAQDSGRLIESFNAAFWVLRQSSVLLKMDQSDWVVKKVSYYETVRRLMAGANPVHSRFSLMHAYRDVLSHSATDPDLVSKRPTHSYVRHAQQG